MIPKRLVSVWVSDKPVPVVGNYSASWSEVMPDYEVILLGETDLPESKCVSAMMAKGKPVAAAQYMAFKYLYDHGGIYLDLDMEAVKPFDDLLKYRAFVGHQIENSGVWLNCAAIGAEAGHPFVREILDSMDTFDFSHREAELELGPRLWTRLLERKDWKRKDVPQTVAGVQTLMSDILYPYSWKDELTESTVKPATVAVHHHARTWHGGVTIVIPCYNHADVLHEAIESALAQTLPPDEIIVVDDGSTVGNVRTVCDKYGVVCVEQDNAGLSAARNTGIHFAQTEWILTLDADDRLHPHFLRRTLGVDDIVGVGTTTFGARVGGVWDPPKKHPTYQDFMQANQIVCCSLMRKSVWENAGGYDESEMMRHGYEDWDFWTRATFAGATVTCVQDRLFEYRTYADDRTGQSGTYAHAKIYHDELREYMLSKYAAMGLREATMTSSIELSGFRHLSLEAGTDCNLSREHPRCPSSKMKRKGELMTVNDMVIAIGDAVRLGFNGWVGYHFYNEPLLYVDRIREVMRRTDYPRHMLWTNGELLTEEIARMFGWITITDYHSQTDRWNALKAACPRVRIDVIPAKFDDRLDGCSEPAEHVTCWRQKLEIPIDAFGNVRLCCQDWSGTVELGNIRERGLSAVMTDAMPLIRSLSEGTDAPPDICALCSGRQTEEQYRSALASVGMVGGTPLNYPVPLARGISPFEFDGRTWKGGDTVDRETAVAMKKARHLHDARIF